MADESDILRYKALNKIHKMINSKHKFDIFVLRKLGLSIISRYQVTLSYRIH